MAPKAVPIPRGRLPHPSRSRPIKDSFRSHSSEADDERSSTASDRMSPERRNSTSSDRARARSANSHQLRVDTGNGSPPPGRYPGEDTRSTSSKELAGWYAYAFAAEVYVVCAIGTVALATR
jgi:MFS transporter, UMF1 family